MSLLLTGGGDVGAVEDDVGTTVIDSMNATWLPTLESMLYSDLYSTPNVGISDTCTGNGVDLPLLATSHCHRFQVTPSPGDWTFQGPITSPHHWSCSFHP